MTEDWIKQISLLGDWQVQIYKLIRWSGNRRWIEHSVKAIGRQNELFYQSIERGIDVVADERDSEQFVILFVYT